MILILLKDFGLGSGYDKILVYKKFVLLVWVFDVFFFKKNGLSMKMLFFL